MAELLSIAQTGQDSDGRRLVIFTVSFAEPVTSVDADVFIRTTRGNVAGASIAGVAAVPGTGGSSYPVTVDAGTGTGTLALAAAGTILDLTGGDAFVPAFDRFVVQPTTPPGPSFYHPPFDIAAGDFDEDGNLDLLAAKWDGSFQAGRGTLLTG